MQDISQKPLNFTHCVASRFGYPNYRLSELSIIRTIGYPNYRLFELSVIRTIDYSNYRWSLLVRIIDVLQYMHTFRPSMKQMHHLKT